MVIEGLRSVLKSQKLLKKRLEIEVSTGYSNALKLLNNRDEDYSKFDLIIADVDLESSISSPLNLGDKRLKKIKEMNHDSKIVAIIRSKDNYRIYRILRKLKPDGFLLETEIDTSNLTELLDSVLQESVYYSKTIFKVLNKNQTRSLVLDDIDREILYLLSKGVKTKNLTDYIARSLSALEKRKQRIKDLLVMNNCSDDELIESAMIQELI
jgi:DNA-binding NarL/FixJ family response regulator